MNKDIKINNSSESEKRLRDMEKAAISDYKNGVFKLESIKSYLSNDNYNKLKREEKLKELLDERQ